MGGRGGSRSLDSCRRVRVFVRWVDLRIEHEQRARAISLLTVRDEKGIVIMLR